MHRGVSDSTLDDCRSYRRRDERITVLLDEPNGIATLPGHGQLTTTVRFYGHVDLEEKREAIEVNPPP